MLSKKPIVCSNLSAMPEIIKNNYNGLLVEPNEPVLLSNCIKLLFKYSLRKKLSANGFFFVKKKFFNKKNVY